MFTQPVEREFAEAKSVLLMGMGGGYDVFAALPLYFALTRNACVQAVRLGNLSFTRNLEEKRGRRVTPHCVEVRFFGRCFHRLIRIGFGGLRP